jgi:hypothetical protein
MAWFSRKGKVIFIDDATGSAFATTEMPPSDLPETFEIATTLHLGDTDWSEQPTACSAMGPKRASA